MENVIRELNFKKKMVIYGREQLENHFENDIDRKRFLAGLVEEFEYEADEITIMNFNGLLMVKIESDETISRVYTSDGMKYFTLPNADNTSSILNILSVMKGDLKLEDSNAPIIFNDNYGKYIKSIKGFAIPGKTLKMIQDYIYSEVNVLLKGGPGTGKTDLPQRLAEQLDMECLVIDCGTIKTPQDWFGTREFVEGKGTEFVASELIEYIQKPCIIVLDEINRTTPDCHNSIFRILDGNRKVHILPLKKTIEVHPHCIIMATMNEGRSHTGTFMLDSAITDRFEIFNLDIPSQSQITKILKNRYPLVHPLYLDAIAKLTHKLNDLYNDETLNVQIGLRPALSACVLITRNNKFIDVLNQSFVSRFSSEGGVDSECSIVRQTMTGLIESELLQSINCTLNSSDNLYGDDNDFDNHEFD